MNIVIDTNVFVSSFLSLKDAPKRVIDLWKTGRIILCLSRDIIAEYVEVLARFGLAGQPELRELLDLFARRINVVFVPSPQVLPVIPDDSVDEKFIACAVAAKAEYVVFGDKHLLKLGEYGSIGVVTPSQFMKSFPDRT
jgi:uncharacterized protein